MNIRTNQWLAVGFSNDEVFFYLVSNEKNENAANKKAQEAGFSLESVSQVKSYRWYKPSKADLFRLPYENGKPNFSQIKDRLEQFLNDLERIGK